MLNVVESQDVIEFRVKNFDADSLVLVIKEKEGKEKVDALNCLSNVLGRKDIDSSLYCATKAIRIAEKLRYRKGLADGYFFLGNYYYLLDSIRPMITNYLKALRIYEDLKPCEEYANLCSQLAVVNALRDRWENTLPYWQKTLELYHKLNDTLGIRSATVGIALNFNYLGERDSAILYNKKALAILDKYPNPAQYGCVYNELGRLNGQNFSEFKDTAYITKAISYFAKGLELATHDELLNPLTFNIAAYYKRYNSPD